MVVSVDRVVRDYVNVTAGTPISVDMPVYEERDVFVYYGKGNHTAVQNVDYFVTLAEDFETFLLTPTSGLIAKINTLIAGDADEVNRVVVRRVLELTTESTPGGVRNTPFTSRELDRNALRDQQLADGVARSVRLADGNRVPYFDMTIKQVPDDVSNSPSLVFLPGGGVGAGPNAEDLLNASAYAERAEAAAANAAVGTPYGFNTLTSLKSNDSLSYTAGMNKVVVSVGQHVIVEGFLAEVVASDAAAGTYAFTNNNSVKFKPVLNSGTCHARWWNVLPSNTALVNDVGLIAMRNQMIATDNQRLWNLHFDAGTYQYTDNKWSRNIRDLVMDLNGAALQCVSTSPSQRAKRLFDESSPWFDGDIDSIDSTPAYFGYRIDTAEDGVSSVFVKTAADAANFAVGDRILLCASDKQFAGFPPNMRYFQFTQVAAVDLETGEIELTDNTQFRYHENATRQWTGDYAFLGSARILNMDREGGDGFILPRLRIIRNGVLKQNPSSAQEGNVASATYVRWENLQFDGALMYMWPSIADVAEIVRCRPKGGSTLASEVDKTVVSLLYQQNYINGTLTGGTSVLKAHFLKNHLARANGYEAGGEVLWERNRFAEDPPTQFGVLSMTSPLSYGPVTFDANEFRIKSDSDLLHYVNAQTDIGSGNVGATPSGAFAGYLEFDLTNSVSLALVQGAARGRLIYSADLTDIGTITEVVQQDTTASVLIRWFVTATPSTSKKYIIVPCDYIVDMGNNKLTVDAPFTRGSGGYEFTGAPVGDGRNGVLTRNLNGVDSLAILFMFSRAPRVVKRIVIDVVRAYTGSDATATLTLRTRLNAVSKSVLVVNLKTAGRRVVEVNAVAGAETGDTIAAITAANRLVNDASLTTFNGSGVLLATSNDVQKPIVVVSVDYDTPVLPV